jgi:hypothetical protein
MTADGYRRTVNNDLNTKETDRILNETIRNSEELERQLTNQIEQDLLTNSEVQDNLGKIKECLDSVQNKLKSLNDIIPNNNDKDLIVENVNESANKANTLLDKILKLISESNNTNNLDFNVYNIYNEYIKVFDSLNIIQKGAFVHTLFCILLLLFIFDILVAYYSNKLIIYLNIENKMIRYFNKYPILVKYIQLRRKFQSYYIKLNFILIIILTLFTLYTNIYILLNYLP